MRVLFVGEAWPTVLLESMGFDAFHMGRFDDYGRWFKDAMTEFADVEVVHMPNHVAFSSFPSSVGELKKFDVVLLSDIGSNTLVLYPNEYKVPMGPNRLKVIRDYVKQGGGFVMAGGWYSFSGETGRAKYHGTAVEEALPVEIDRWDDRVETPEGVAPRILEPSYEVFRGIQGVWPLFMGYNRVRLKDGADLLAEIDGDPFIAVWGFGDGRSMALTSDLAPHWGAGFVKWEYYPRFWRQTLKWLAGDKVVSD